MVARLGAYDATVRMTLEDHRGGLRVQDPPRGRDVIGERYGRVLATVHENHRLECCSCCHAGYCFVISLRT